MSLKRFLLVRVGRLISYPIRRLRSRSGPGAFGLLIAG